MQKRSTVTLGVCICNPMGHRIFYGNLFFERIWDGILQGTNRHNYSVLHYPESVRESVSCDAFLDGRIDGVLYHAAAQKNARPERMAGMPTVLQARSLDLPEG